MRLHGAMGLALLSAIALAPAPVAASGPETDDCSSIWPGPPMPPIAVRAAPTGALTGSGVRLDWHDDLNPALGVSLAGYSIFRAGPDNPLPAFPLANVGPEEREFIDPTGTIANVYWLTADSSCTGSSWPSNPASSGLFVIDCVDVQFEVLPPWAAILVERNCGNSPPCYTAVYLIPPDTDEWCD